MTFKSLKKDDTQINLVYQFLGQIAENQKAIEQRQCGKQNFEERINAGKAMPDNELLTCILWILNKIEEILKNYDENWQEISFNDAWELQKYIIFWCSFFFSRAEKRNTCKNDN